MGTNARHFTMRTSTSIQFVDDYPVEKPSAHFPNGVLRNSASHLLQD